ncbi:hypothetical protein Q1M63_33175 [Sinorhizobium meliloti]|nr:hypothetical protein Q1M63_33175 [Sinorhizobium meliloti]
MTTPHEAAKAGQVQIAGVAFGGMNACKSVEVSVDGGQTWQEAEFIGPDLGRFAWRVFCPVGRSGAGDLHARQPRDRYRG